MSCVSVAFKTSKTTQFDTTAKIKSENNSSSSSPTPRKSILSNKTQQFMTEKTSRKRSHDEISNSDSEDFIKNLLVEHLKFIKTSKTKNFYPSIESQSKNSILYKMYKKHAEFLANRKRKIISEDDKSIKNETLNQVHSKKPRIVSADKLYRIYSCLKQINQINKKFSEKRKRETTIEQLSEYCDRNDIEQAVKDGSLRLRTIKNFDENGEYHGDFRKIVLFPKYAVDESVSDDAFINSSLDWYCFQCHKEVKKYVLDENVCSRCTRVFCHDNASCKDAFCCEYSIQTEMRSV